MVKYNISWQSRSDEVERKLAEGAQACAIAGEINSMKIPDFLKSTYTMLYQAFPNGVDEESYWVLLYLLYDYMADENVALIMSAFVDRSLGVITNDIYKVYRMNFNKKAIKEVKRKLDTCGFEDWKKEV